MADSDIQQEAKYVESMASAFVHMDGKSQESVTAGDHLFREVDGYLRENPSNTKALQDQINADRAANKSLPVIAIDEHSFMVQPAPGDTSPTHAVRFQSR